MSKSLTLKQASKMKCEALLDLAAKDKSAAKALKARANNWSTCAVGEMADKLKVDPFCLYSSDPKSVKDEGGYTGTQLELSGYRFARQVNDKHYGRAKRTYQAIAQRVKKLFGTKAKRVKLGLQAR